MTKANTERGKVTERFLATYLREHGFPHAERAVKTGVVTRTRTVVDPGDITGTPGLVWQAKALKPLTRAENEVPGWMHETEEQRVGAGADLGVLVVRRDQRPAEQWFAFVPLVDLLKLVTGTPAWLGEFTERDAMIATPVRMYLGDLVTLLRSCGYGDPILEPSRPATA